MEAWRQLSRRGRGRGVARLGGVSDEDISQARAVLRFPQRRGGQTGRPYRVSPMPAASSPRCGPAAEVVPSISVPHFATTPRDSTPSAPFRMTLVSRSFLQRGGEAGATRR
jgi:hypothetical protein